MKPPAEVALVTSAQVPPGGGVAWVIWTVSLAATLPGPSFFLLHAASATTAMMHARLVRTFIHSLRLIAGMVPSSSCEIDGGPLLAAICAASDSRQWRSSGSAISR